ncbi:hypothetical protein ACFVFQ_20130 [Streptomyces sp. NPDC057743]|uniref:hypothetical protein n=1 Tax=Streptomyces sp. NPDC057743 TaxID=3346236 RepID=UPI0036B57948
MGASPEDYINEIIPPSDDKEREKLERKADAFLEAAGDEVWDVWPGSWPRRKETEFDRIAAAHTGSVPLAAVSIVASLPECDLEVEHHTTEELMQERPGAQAADTLSQLLEGTAITPSYGSGFVMERRNFPPETCRWSGCNEPLYVAEAPCKAGRPPRHCGAHKKAAKARTRRLRYRGIRVGKNRNLVYDFPGLRHQDLTGYRQLWGRVNTARS